MKKISGILILLSLICACRKEPSLDPDTIRQVLTHRNLGLAHLEEGRPEDAKNEFKKWIELAPGEAAPYANLGLAYMRLNQYREAEEQVKKALTLSKDPDIVLILADVLERSGRVSEAIRELESSLPQNPRHSRSRYKLSQLLARSNLPEAAAKREEQLTELVQLMPANLTARLQLIEILLKRGKPALAATNLEQVRQQVGDLSPETAEYMNAALTSMRRSDSIAALPAAIAVHNLLKPTPPYQAAIMDLVGPGGALMGFPIYQLSPKFSIKMQAATSGIVSLRFVDVTAASGLSQVRGALQLAPADIDTDGDTDLYISGSNLLLSNDRGHFSSVRDNHGLAGLKGNGLARFADYDNDGRQDLLIALEGAAKLYRGSANGKFVENSSFAEKISPQGSLFLDLDQDGDLDLLLSDGKQMIGYRNNGDETFTQFIGNLGLAPFNRALFADFDEDGDLDLYLQASGSAGLYSNLRLARFEDMTHAGGLPAKAAGALAAADFNNDGFVDLLAGNLYQNRGNGTFARSNFNLTADDVAVLDFDNDGWEDLVAAGNKVRLYRNNGSGEFKDVSSLLPANIPAAKSVTILDYDSDGDEDLLFVCGDGSLRLLRNEGGNANHWLTVRLQALAAGSGKNNRDGIGARIEVKTAELSQMRVVSSQRTHFGLGQKTQADVVRIIWTNGVPQNHVQLAVNHIIIEKQVLKGSCPFLYTWNGKSFELFTDLMWKSALGMPLGIMQSATTYAFPNSSDEFLKIPGDRLQPKDGSYIVQITEELWETPYLDKTRLIAVDHPNTVDFYIDEKFVVPPFPPLKFYPVSERLTPLSATDEKGSDVLQLIQAKDDRYVSDFAPGKYQGWASMHELILDLGRLRMTDDVVLFLNGWIFPSDASINVASLQSNQRTVPPYLQVRDRNGEWRTVIENVGFPMGKNKMVIADLYGKFLIPDFHVRICTTMQIYWDHVFFTRNEPSIPLRLTTLKPVSADLHYRGFSKTYRKGDHGPHWFDYNQVSKEPHWRDLEGFYTRYGDVKDLLQEADDQYVIINSGDELTVRFDANQAPKLRHNWTRDFLIYNDGWIKDGDLNTAFSKTVEPLPFHKIKQYPYASGESYPAALNEYRKTYNTRQVKGVRPLAEQ